MKVIIRKGEKDLECLALDTKTDIPFFDFCQEKKWNDGCNRCCILSLFEEIKGDKGYSVANGVYLFLKNERQI